MLVKLDLLSLACKCLVTKLRVDDNHSGKVTREHNEGKFVAIPYTLRMSEDLKQMLHGSTELKLFTLLLRT